MGPYEAGRLADAINNLAEAVRANGMPDMTGVSLGRAPNMTKEASLDDAMLENGVPMSPEAGSVDDSRGSVDDSLACAIRYAADRIYDMVAMAGMHEAMGSEREIVDQPVGEDRFGKQVMTHWGDLPGLQNGVPYTRSAWKGAAYVVGLDGEIYMAVSGLGRLVKYDVTGEDVGANDWERFDL